MVQVYSEYNGDALSPQQIEMLHQGLINDLNAMAAGDPEDEAEADEPEAG